MVGCPKLNPFQVYYKKMNRTMWSPKSFILKPFLERQKWVNFLAIASIFRTLFVKNLATKMNSLEPISLPIRKPSPSVTQEGEMIPSYRDILHGKIQVFPNSQTKYPTSPTTNSVYRGDTWQVLIFGIWSRVRKVEIEDLDSLNSTIVIQINKNKNLVRNSLS